MMPRYVMEERHRQSLGPCAHRGRQVYTGRVDGSALMPDTALLHATSLKYSVGYMFGDLHRPDITL